MPSTKMLQHSDQEVKDRGHYVPLEGALEDSEDNVSRDTRVIRRYSILSSWKVMLCIHGALLTVSGFMFSASGAAMNFRRARNAEIKAVSFYSPVLNKVDLSLRDQQVRDTRYPPEDEMGVYRQPPSPEVDNAWDRISDVQAILISSEEVQRLGKDPGRTVKAPQSWGYGEDAHWAEIDVFHQIHCLNSIRQSLYRDYYVGKDNDTNPLAWGHITHCLHNLVQALMCSASADVITYNWVDGKPKPVPDFNINHKCRDFEKLLQWQNEHKLPDPKSKWEDITMPVDFVPLAPDMSGLDEEE